MKPDVEELIAAARAAFKLAYAPYSRYSVGAALRTDDGRIFTGCNVENCSYGLSICAERNAVFAAVAAGSREFEALALVVDAEHPTTPCGACRQVLAEFCADDFPIYTVILKRDDELVLHRLGELLPHSFELEGG